MLKQLGIAIGIMIVLVVIIIFLNKKKENYNSSPYQILDYVNNRKSFNSKTPIALR